ncbi:MAG TPA: ABC transporter permease [Candidatus Dormibacteraeota bacterium]|nr:ABC transporter permease [Candidatus Dormibacteraeota bacterium]
MATELSIARLPSRVRPADAATWLWKRTWPPLGAALLFIGAWQVVTLAGVWPDYLLPGPIPVLSRLSEDLRDPALYTAMRITGTRALAGYSLAIVIGLAMGLAVSRSAVVRSAVGSLITGLQSMPSIAWFPLAILLFGINEAAITFVVVLGAAPAIANGLITGIDHIPPILLRYGRAAGARNWSLYQRIVLPAALPSFVGGLKQGWAFAWRSLMAGELLVIIAQQPSIGERLAYAREFADAEGLLSMMIIILLIGIVVDRLFAAADHWIRRRWGLIESS